MDTMNLSNLDATCLMPEEPPAYLLHEGQGYSPFVIACDHASPSIPRILGDLGVSALDRLSHIAWDIGVTGLAQSLAARLGADLVLQNYSRLVIDCNRPLDAPDSIVERSAGISVPGNIGLPAFQREQRVRGIFRPYHDCLETLLERRRLQARPTTFIALHSFTPNFCGVLRPWHVGVLYQRDSRLALQLLTQLGAKSGLVVGDNEPYRVSDQSDYSVIQYGERAGRLHVELEVRQDLIGDAVGQSLWADILSNALSAAMANMAKS
jgi:predicted N-formylglutamate amidohydrolase